MLPESLLTLYPNAIQEHLERTIDFTEIWRDHDSVLLKSSEWKIISNFSTSGVFHLQEELPFDQNLVYLKTPGEQLRIVHGGSSFTVIDNAGREKPEAIDVLVSLWEKNIMAYFNHFQSDVLVGHLLDGDLADARYFTAIEGYALCLTATGRSREMHSTSYSYIEKSKAQACKLDSSPWFGMFNRDDAQMVSNALIEIPNIFEGLIIKSAARSDGSVYELLR